MKRNFVTPVFNRRKDLEKRGFSKVELLICLTRKDKKYISVKECNEKEWATFQHSAELKAQIAFYNDVVNRMYDHNEAMTVANLNELLGIKERKSEKKEIEKRLLSPTSFIDFMREELAKEKIVEGTRKHTKGTIDAIEEFGRLNRFADLTPKNVKAFDEAMRTVVTAKGTVRTATTVDNYHKVLKKYARLAYEYDYIEKNPYEHPMCHFKKGECAERQPLNEAELKKLIDMELSCKKKETARDLFIFSAYTGLAYIDAQSFDFENMTEKIGGTVYIDGSRVKTGQSFFTPILPPAMEVLKKYNYRLPKISNQKLNDYLHIIEAEACIKKSMTSHVARHSFATLLISYGVPIENVAKMMGHAEIKTTQMYAKVMKETVDKFTQNLLKDMNMENTNEKRRVGRPRKTA